MNQKVRRGYVQIDCYNRPIWHTFTTDMTVGGRMGWKYVEIFPCETTTTTTTALPFRVFGIEFGIEFA